MTAEQHEKIARGWEKLSKDKRFSGEQRLKYRLAAQRRHLLAKLAAEKEAGIHDSPLQIAVRNFVLKIVEAEKAKT